MQIIAYDILLVFAVFAVYLTVEPSLIDPILLFKDFVMLFLYSVSIIIRCFILAPFRCLKKCCCCCLRKHRELPTEESTFTVDGEEVDENENDGSRVNLAPGNVRPYQRIEDYFGGERSPIIKAKSSLVMILVLALVVLHASHSHVVIDGLEGSGSTIPVHPTGQTVTVIVPGEVIEITTKTTVHLPDHHSWNDDLLSE